MEPHPEQLDRPELPAVNARISSPSVVVVIEADRTVGRCPHNHE